MVHADFIYSYGASSGQVTQHFDAPRALKRIREEMSSKGYAGDHASFLVPNDVSYLADSRALAAEFSDCDVLVLVGIGGSNLGTLAVLEALRGKWHFGQNKRIFFLDSPDSRKTENILLEVAALSKIGNKPALAVVSKSGSTAETAALSAVAYERLRNTAGLSADRCVAITEAGSKLAVFAASEGWRTLTAYPKVGGRYSVFSNVGLFPLAFAGIDVENLVEGAKYAVNEGFGNGNADFGNASVEGAWYLYEGSLTGRNTVDHFFFSDSFESVGKWYRQLLGESVGKEYAKDTHRRISAGLTPTVSIGSTDLHSVGQLYLWGPRDKSFVFVTTTVERETAIPVSGLSATVDNLPGKSLSFLMDAIFSWTKEAYLSKGIPFVEWKLAEGSAFDLGYFMQTKMCEVAILGFLFGVDPFDQPNVEDYKTGTKAALAS